MRVACVAPPSPYLSLPHPSVPLLRGIRPGRQVSVIIALSTLNRVMVIRANEIMPFGSFFIVLSFFKERNFTDILTE